mmetsp:Transcript_55891/g.120924  ORF Transcript_55891/g.120924 Transcript_55891/m.120924 type:complete len:272 (+) Transcript_55891:71-886(+)
MQGTRSDGACAASTSNSLQHLDARFFKTKLCAFNFVGACSRGEMCTFAHSEGELVNLPGFRGAKSCHGPLGTRGCRDRTRIRHALQEPSKQVNSHAEPVLHALALPELCLRKGACSVWLIPEVKAVSDDEYRAEEDRGQFSRQSTDASEVNREWNLSDEHSESESESQSTSQSNSNSEAEERREESQSDSNSGAEERRGERGEKRGEEEDLEESRTNGPRMRQGLLKEPRATQNRRPDVRQAWADMTDDSDTGVASVLSGFLPTSYGGASR